MLSKWTYYYQVFNFRVNISYAEIIFQSVYCLKPKNHYLTSLNSPIYHLPAAKNNDSFLRKILPLTNSHKMLIPKILIINKFSYERFPKRYHPLCLCSFFLPYVSKNKFISLFLGERIVSRIQNICWNTTWLNLSH